MIILSSKVLVSCRVTSKDLHSLGIMISLVRACLLPLLQICSNGPFTDKERKLFYGN